MTTVSSDQLCPLYEVRPYTIFFINTRNIFGGLIIPIGIFLSFFGRKFIKVSSFIVTTLTAMLVLGCAFSSTFLLEESERWKVIVTYVGASVFSAVFGMISAYFTKVGGSIIGGVAGFILGILLNTAWLYRYSSIIVTYGVSAGLFLLIFIQCLIGKFTFNQTTVIATSLIGAYLILQGVAVFIGSFPNMLLLIGAMQRSSEQVQIDVEFYYWLGGILALGAVAAVV